MGSGGMGQFIKGLELGIIIKVALAFLPMITSKLKSGYAEAYVSDTRGGGQPVTDPAIIQRNIERTQFKILNANKPPSLTRRERGKGVSSRFHPLVDPDEMNIGLTGFEAKMNAYYSELGRY